jgi:hypothetical protein
MCTTPPRPMQPTVPGSEVFIVPSTASLPPMGTVERDRPTPWATPPEDATLLLTADDDLTLFAARLKLGLPMRGFDGREIPLRCPSGESVSPIEAGHALLRSAASLLPRDAADAHVATVTDRAAAMEAAADAAGEAPAVVVARVTAVLVSGAVRASVLAKQADACPSDLNRATLSWYERSELRRQELLDAERRTVRDQLSA